MRRKIVYVNLLKCVEIVQFHPETEVLMKDDFLTQITYIPKLPDLG